MIERIDIQDIVKIAKDAGGAILAIYNRDFTVEYKDDKSPLTEADKKANEIICSSLAMRYPHIPIVSEENAQVDYEIRKKYDYFWLIDPLDGTREFVKKNGEFTVNIALIQDGKPMLGVVYAPVIGVVYYAKAKHGAYKEVGGVSQLLPIERRDDKCIIVGSKSHSCIESEMYISNIKTDKIKEYVLMGSSLKLCLVAEGVADVYPRLAPTMEWDTAAADAIVRECNKRCMDLKTGALLRYNKENMLNPWFVVSI